MPPVAPTTMAVFFAGSVTSVFLSHECFPFRRLVPVSVLPRTCQIWMQLGDRRASGCRSKSARGARSSGSASAMACKILLLASWFCFAAWISPRHRPDCCSIARIHGCGSLCVRVRGGCFTWKQLHGAESASSRFQGRSLSCEPECSNRERARILLHCWRRPSAIH